MDVVNTRSSNYAQSVNYGIGRIVLAKMLNLNASEVEEALRNLPLASRARQGVERRAQEEREKAEQLREQACALDGEDKLRVEREAIAAQARARRDEELIQRRDWYDARASEVFDRATHGRVF